MMLVSLLVSLLARLALGQLELNVTYLPSLWTGICHGNVSNSSVSTSDVQIDVQCFVPKSGQIHWKLNDLRDWTENKIKNQMTPSNWTFVYNVTVTCETGANISLPWPIQVFGLRELHVTNCRLVDKYTNRHDITDSLTSDDLRVLEIRHSTGVGKKTNQLFTYSNGYLSITSGYDCGQESSLESIIISNVSKVLIANLDEDIFDITHQNNRLQHDNLVRGTTQLSTNVSTIFFQNGPVKPEDRMMKDTALEDLISERKRLNLQTKCKFSKLRTIDESIARLTSRHHFEFMIQGGEYPVLENMNYSSNGFKELPTQLTQWRIYFPKLKHLDVSHNYISEVNIPAYPSISENDLVTFNLRHNNITFISMDILKLWAEVDNLFVDIKDNPIHCDCKLSALLPDLETNSAFNGKLGPYEYIRFLSCRTPATLAGRRLHTLTQDSLICPVSGTNKTDIIALSAVMAVLVLAIIVIIRFKVEIRILLYTRLHVRLPCDADVQRSNKTFDAFVSYSNDDTAWVCENLITFLEQSPTNSTSNNNNANNNNNKSTKPDSNGRCFKLCVHQRDFIPGKTIFDNIVDSIEASRHTILVLSPSFMRSHWAMEELRQAYRQSLVERTRHLIVILLEKVPNDKMDPLISRCCKTFTYLEVDDALFKDRLVFSLTTKDNGAKRRDRLADNEKRGPEICNQKLDYNIDEVVDETYVYPNEEAYSPS